jgi:hypothetical protein
VSWTKREARKMVPPSLQLEARKTVRVTWWHEAQTRAVVVVVSHNAHKHLEPRMAEPQRSVGAVEGRMGCHASPRQPNLSRRRHRLEEACPLYVRSVRGQRVLLDYKPAVCNQSLVLVWQMFCLRRWQRLR